MIKQIILLITTICIAVYLVVYSQLFTFDFSSNQLEDNNIGLSFKKNSDLNMNYLGGKLNAYKIINYYNKF